MDLIRSPWSQSFDMLIQAAQDRLDICSPYIGREPIERLMRKQTESIPTGKCAVSLLVDRSRDNLLSRATDAAAIAALMESCQHVNVRHLPGMHAKAYVADDAVAVVTSANMTRSGLSRNFELGVSIYDRPTVIAVREQIADYGKLGVDVPLDEMQNLAKASIDLHILYEKTLRSARRKLANEFDQRVAEADERLLRLRVAGRSATAIFAETLLYLLRRGPMRTVEINPLVQALHPDLCDDTVDRVIDGEHFGKKWKHSVRNAQQYLKRQGHIRRDGNLWSLNK